MYQLCGLVTIVLFLFSIIIFCWLKVHYWQRLRVTSPRGHWLYGNFNGIRKGLSLNDIFFNYYRQYQGTGVPYVGLYALTKPFLLVLDSQLAKRILSEDFASFRNRGLYKNHEDLSSNLFTLDYVKWKELRTKVSPTFTNAKLKSMLSRFMNTTSQLVEVLESDSKHSDGIVDIRDLMLRFTIDIIASCAFGVQANSLCNPNNEFLKMAHTQSLGEDNSQLSKFIILCYPNAARLLGLKYMPTNLTEFYTKFINEIVTSREQLQIRNNDFMDTLIDMINKDGTEFALKELTSNSFLFFQAGYETSAFTLTYILYELARHREVQHKARTEVYNVLEKCGNDLRYETLNQMKYVEQIIKETLRLYPVSPTLVRQCTQDYTISDYPNLPPVTIKKGQTVIISAYSLQRNNQYYSQGEQFNPDNFAEGNLNSNVFLSFGDGPRNCVGMRFANMQILIGLVLLLKNFTFEFCEKTEDPIKYKAASVLLSTENEIYLKVKKYTQH